MSKMVGFSRPVKLEWLDKVAELVMLDKEEETIKAELHEFLSFEIASPTNLRKTREILLSIWVRCPEKIKKMAIKAMKGNKNERLAVHWSLVMLAYPVFLDSAAYMGKVTKLQSTFTATWLKEKLSEIWGERDTMLESVSRITNSMRSMGILEVIKQGEYKTNSFVIASNECVEFISMVILQIAEKAYYEIDELPNVPYMFPFEFELTHEIVYNSTCLNISNMSGKAVLMAE